MRGAGPFPPATSEAGDAQVEHRAVREPTRGWREIFGHRDTLREADAGVLRTAFIDVERGQDAHHHIAILFGHDASSGIGLSITVTLDMEDRRAIRATSAQEVSVKRVEMTIVIDCEAGGPGRLRGDLSTEEL